MKRNLLLTLGTTLSLVAADLCIESTDSDLQVSFFPPSPPIYTKTFTIKSLADIDNVTIEILNKDLRLPFSHWTPMQTQSLYLNGRCKSLEEDNPDVCNNISDANYRAHIIDTNILPTHCNHFHIHDPIESGASFYLYRMSEDERASLQIEQKGPTAIANYFSDRTFFRNPFNTTVVTAKYNKNGEEYSAILHSCEPEVNIYADAWDIFRTEDRNISTKVVNKPFYLKVTLLNDDGSENQEDLDGIEIDFALYDMQNKKRITEWRRLNYSDDDVIGHHGYRCQFGGVSIQHQNQHHGPNFQITLVDNNDTTTQDVAYTIDKAYKDVRVIFRSCVRYIEDESDCNDHHHSHHDNFLNNFFDENEGHTHHHRCRHRHHGDHHGKRWFYFQENTSCTVDCNVTTSDNCYEYFFSSDNFAIRPKKYDIEVQGSRFFAEDEFNITFKALDANDTPSPQYNEQLATSFEVDVNDTKVGCSDGRLDFNETVWKFKNGEKKLLATHNDIGTIEITIHEKDDCFERFAAVDCDDKEIEGYFTLEDTKIKPKTIQIVVDPYEINVTEVEMNTSTQKRWLYMSHHDDMRMRFRFRVRVRGKKGTELIDFNPNCYATDINLSLGFDTDYITPAPILFTGNFTDDSTELSDINKTLIVPADTFTDGDANTTFSLGIDRNASKAIDPIFIHLKNVSVTTPDIAKEYIDAQTNNLTTDTEGVFVYGRIHPLSDSLNIIKGNEGNVSIYYEIYATDKERAQRAIGTSVSESIDGLDWYINASHQASDGTITSVTSSNPAIHIDRVQTVNGKTVVTLSYTNSDTNPLATTILDIDAPAYLLYDPYDPTVSGEKARITFTPDESGTTNSGSQKWKGVGNEPKDQNEINQSTIYRYRINW